MTTTVTAPDIVCDGCANAIRNALSRVEGVSSVQVDVAAKKVSVTHGDHLARADVEKALDNAGFPVEPLK